jgi:DNA modification methylase
MASDVRLYCGDCLELLPTLAPQSIDAIICDPPYGTTSCKWDSAIPFDDMWTQLKRVIKPNGAIVLFGVQPFTSMLVASNVKNYKHRWVWNKRLPGNFAVAKYMPLTIDEDILVFTASGERVNYYPLMTKGKYRNKGGGSSEKTGRGFGGLGHIPPYFSDDYFPKSILEFSTVTRSSSQHESQKPVDLMEYLIRTYTQVGETVLDFTAGSGSTGVACINTGRNFVGIEKDAGYFEIAQRRITEAQAQPALLELV